MVTRAGRERVEEGEVSLSEKVVFIRRVAKVVKGGRRFHFNAVVVVGDGAGRVGVGIGKAEEVPEAIRKGSALARKNLMQVALKESTIPHTMRMKFGASDVLLKPAPPGTGVIAGSSVRAVVEAAGVKNIVTKSLGSPNPINVVKATLLALGQMRDLEKEIALRKGRSVAAAPSALPGAPRTPVAGPAPAHAPAPQAGESAPAATTAPKPVQAQEASGG
ncbi:MAG: 30S ribosomal protein S5 [Chloroflexi bacterium]|nr:30S ribosomal protein S5 [Chloroflexota bacterium]